MFQKGDLVFVFGSLGLILDIRHSMNLTDYLIFWFPQPHQYGPSWISKKHLSKVY